MVDDLQKTTRYRARECHLSGRWIVETEMGCINGLTAWVTLADCGAPDPSDQMCGFDGHSDFRVERSVSASYP